MIAQVDSRFIKQSIKKTYTRYLSYALYEGRPLTTKGRWINPLIFSLYRFQSILPLAKKIIKPVFILGTGRSGTTILGITLAIHKDIGFLNEPKALWSYLIDNEDLIGNYHETPGNYRLTAKDATLPMIKKAHRIYGNYLRFVCASQVVDKYPELIFRTEFVTTIFPDARFLFLYRNGHDTCNSINLWSENSRVEKNGEIQDWWGLNDRKWKLLCEQVVAYDDVIGPHMNEIYRFSNHAHRAAVEWIVSMKEGLGLMAHQAVRIMGVKYEDYINRVATRKQVLKFCDLDPDERFNQFCKTVLKAPRKKNKLDLPPVIQNEFTRVMDQLGYEQ